MKELGNLSEEEVNKDFKVWFYTFQTSPEVLGE